MDLSEEVSSAQTPAVEITGIAQFDERGPQTESMYVGRVGSISSNTGALPNSLSSQARTTVLMNEDILEIVFSFFDPVAFFRNVPHIEPSTRKALYSAALTCKSFFNPATTLLWRGMESIIPVLEILPAFVKINDIYTITPGVESEDLERLAFYARKVRYLEFNTFQDTIRSHTVLRLVNLNTPTSSIFPALEVLYIPSLDCRRNIENLSVIFLASPISLTTLYIEGIDSSTEDVISSFLSVLGQIEASIQDLTLEGGLTPSSLSPVQNFRKLRSLNLKVLNGTLHSMFLRVWGRLANLTHLILDLDTTSMFDLGDPNRIEGFETLQKLRLRGLPAEISKILKSIQESKTLTTISLVAVSPMIWSQLESLSVSNCIMECGRISSSLRHLSLLMRGGRKDSQLPQKALTPLASCKQLESFELSGVSLPINDDDIRELCANDKWSKIRVLHLPTATIDHAPSLSGLQILARHCPNLVNLTICVDLRLHDDLSLQRERSGPRIPHRLKQLRLSIIKLPTGSDTNTTEMGISVSRFIEYHFPYLKEPEFVSNAAGDAKWWKGVRSMMDEYKTIRAETISAIVETEN
ncbi:hypothetical protein BDZ97DRAFT_1913259 [Flammula alnicola]|nr:hypothetical protein BDZ97DRAFT_1913259 [Flammula alnicola]